MAAHARKTEQQDVAREAEAARPRHAAPASVGTHPRASGQRRERGRRPDDLAAAERRSGTRARRRTDARAPARLRRARAARSTTRLTGWAPTRPRSSPRCASSTATPRRSTSCSRRTRGCFGEDMIAVLNSELSGADLQTAMFLLRRAPSPGMQAVAAEMESMVGQQATWTGSGPGSGQHVRDVGERGHGVGGAAALHRHLDQLLGDGPAGGVPRRPADLAVDPRPVHGRGRRLGRLHGQHALPWRPHSVHGRRAGRAQAAARATSCSWTGWPTSRSPPATSTAPAAPT